MPANRFSTLSVLTFVNVAMLTASVSWVEAGPLRVRNVKWPGADGQSGGSESSPAAAVAAVQGDVPIGGFTPLVVEAMTDERSPSFNFFHQYQPALVGTPLTGTAESNYAVAILDTGAATYLTGFCEAQTLGLEGVFLTERIVPLVGATGEIINALASHPVAVFVDGLDAVNLNTGLLDASELVGHSNVSLAVGPSESCQDGSELPNVVGLPLATLYSTVIRNDRPLCRRINGTVYQTPTLEFHAFDDPNVPAYPSVAPLAAFPAAQTAAYIPAFNSNTLEFEPAVPTSLVGDLAGSLLFGGVALADNALNTGQRLFMLDTGAQITVMNQVTADLIGEDANNPDFTVDIESIGGSVTDVPGFMVDALDITLQSGTFTLHNVPVVLFDVPSPVGGTLPGIIGMNLFTDRNLVLVGNLAAPLLRISDPLAPPVAADLDFDGDVDGTDFLTFSNCFNGALALPQSQCLNLKADLDDDGDVDTFDFLTFSNCFNGSLSPPICP